MRGNPIPLPAIVCLLATVPLAARPVKSAAEAKAIAEQETHGQAVSARRIDLNGASGGWEVLVHMPGEPRGWCCIVDCDTHTVFRKTRVPNPEPSRKKH